MTVFVSLSGCDSNAISTQRGRVPYTSFSGTYTLTNGCVVVVVAPQVGRIIGYHRIGEPNLLWLDANPKSKTVSQPTRPWVNYGGEKVWLTPQALWPKIFGRGWPPDSTTDGDAWIVTCAQPRKLVVVSEITPSLGVRITRTITLPDTSTTVRIEYHLERLSPSSHPVHIWPVTQVRLPNYALLDIARDHSAAVKGNLREANENVVLKVDRNVSAARYDWPMDKKTKVGTFGRWVAAVYDHTIFAQYAELDVTGTYYDQANCEVFINPQQQYMELELLSPIECISVGESLDFTVTWKLFARPCGL